MKAWFLTFFLISLSINYTYAQKVNLEKWVSHTVDSLQKNHVDTIEYYHTYCHECVILRKPPTDTLPTHQCEDENSSMQVENKIIYRQKNKYYSLTFNCGYPPIKKELENVKSLRYFLSIIPILNKRDKIITARYKKHKFPAPIIVDGRYEEAFIYCNNVRQNVFMHYDKKTYKGWSNYLWIDEQIKLLQLINSDISLNRQ